MKDLRLKNCNKIILGHLNINSIANKLDQSDSLVDRNIDVLVITETKLDESYPTAQLLIKGYFKAF